MASLNLGSNWAELELVEVVFVSVKIDATIGLED